MTASDSPSPAAGPRQRVLVVDDDPTVAEVVASYLDRAGFLVDRVADGPSAVARAAAVPPDLVVLDLMLPGLDGLEVCRRIRQRGPVPVVMLTARGDEDDRILGLEVGADDYVTKPFSPRELVLRVTSVLRRAGAAPAPGPWLRSGRLALDPAARRATRDGAELALTAREFDLLSFFLQYPGRVVGREELMRRVWGWEFGDLSTVTVHVRRLREKIEDDPARPHLISTVWGAGYRFDGGEPGSAGAPAPGAAGSRDSGTYGGAGQNGDTYGGARPDSGTYGGASPDSGTASGGADPGTASGGPGFGTASDAGAHHDSGGVLGSGARPDSGTYGGASHASGTASGGIGPGTASGAGAHHDSGGTPGSGARPDSGTTSGGASPGTVSGAGAHHDSGATTASAGPDSRTSGGISPDNSTASGGIGPGTASGAGAHHDSGGALGSGARPDSTSSGGARHDSSATPDGGPPCGPASGIGRTAPYAASAVAPPASPRTSPDSAPRAIAGVTGHA